MLKIETGYTNKEGQFVEYKRDDKTGEVIGKMKVIGKDMSADEKHEFMVLADGIREFTNGKYPNYSMFVKDATGAVPTPFNLNLSNQAWKTIKALNPKKGDILTIWRGEWLNKQTGAVQPIVNAKVDRSEQSPALHSNHPATFNSASDVSSKPDMAQFVKSYEQQVNPNIINLNHFVGTYIRTFFSQDVQPIVDTFNKHFGNKGDDGQ